MRWRQVLLLLIIAVGLSGNAQTVEVPEEPQVNLLAFKVVMRSTKSFFAPGEPVKLEIACVSIPQIASPEWQNRWSNACSTASLHVEEGRLGEYLGFVDEPTWIWNRLYRCLLPPGQSYREASHLRYTEPVWQKITVPAGALAEMRGTVLVDARVALSNGRKLLYDENAQVVTGIVSDTDNDAESGPSSEIQQGAALVQSGNLIKREQLANELLRSPTKGALRLAVRLFDNTERTAPFWSVIESSPHQQLALDLMATRLKDPNLVPDFKLLLNLAGMKARLDNPLEFVAAGGQPYPQYYPDLEDNSVAYFRSLLNSLVDSTDDPQSARAISIAGIAESVSNTGSCPLGTDGVSASEAGAIKAKFSGK